jgi:hypothetical protein
MPTDQTPFNRDFIYTIPSKVLFDENITDLDRKIYMIIRSFMDTTGQCYTSNNWLAEKLKVERRSIITSVNRLVKEQYINKISNGSKRYLVINYTPCSEELVIPGSPPSDPTITPPSDPTITLYSSNNINSKDIIKPLVDSSNSTEVISINIVKDNYQNDSLFRKFYDNYPNKQKPLSAYKAFSKLKPTPEFVDMLVVDLNNRKQNNWKGRDKSKIPHPATYLNAKEWEGEIYSTNQKKESGRKFYTFDEMVGSLTGNEAD